MIVECAVPPGTATSLNRTQTWQALIRHLSNDSIRHPTKLMGLEIFKRIIVLALVDQHRSMFETKLNMIENSQPRS